MVAALQGKGLAIVNWLVIAIGILMVLAGGVSGSYLQMHRARRMRRRDRAYDLDVPHLQHIGAGIGALAGLAIGGLAAYYLALNQQASVFAWIGRLSYVLISWSAGGHLLTLVHIGLHLYREEQSWERRGGPGRQTLGGRRMRLLDQLRREHRHYLDLKSRDEEVLDELVGFLGDPLTHMRRDLTRIPLYGYLGTVCGILLTAQELGQIDEATQTFKALSAMADGLVLAFKTTLVGLLAYLPLRKVADYLLQRLSTLEDAWTRARDGES